MPHFVLVMAELLEVISANLAVLLYKHALRGVMAMLGLEKGFTGYF